MKYFHLYTLDGNGNPVPEFDVHKWGKWFETSGPVRVVDRTRIGDLEVSTVFLSINHRLGEGPPILWETMVFKLGKDGECLEAEEGDQCSIFGELQTRCSGTREQAEAMHREVVRKIKGRHERKTNP
jgi:hypothetical protein